jgi:O-antigen ligase
VLVIALMPFPAILRGWGDPKLPYDYLTILFPVDLAYAGLLVVGLGRVLRRARALELGGGAAVWLALTVVMTAALVVHPSSRGLQRVFELWGVAVLAATFTEAFEGELADLVLGALVAVAIVETIWSGAQLLLGSSLGLHNLGEDARPLWPFGRGVAAPMGSMVHPYVLAGLALVAGAGAAWRAVSARRPVPWLVAAAVAIVPVGYTFSRAGLVSVALVVGGFAVAALRAGSRRSVCLLAVLALCVGSAVPAAIWSKGWRGRATETTAASTAGQLTTERTHLVHEAVTLIRAEPIAGVGPGQYIPALRRGLAVETDKNLLNFRPVHNVVLLVGAEGGTPALLVIAALFVIVGWRALRSGPIAVAVYLSYFPLAMLDHFAYSFPQGLVLTACWLGLLDTMARQRREAA